MTTLRRKVLLVILDGFGVNPSKTNNAVAIADTPNIDRYFARFPHTVIQSAPQPSAIPSKGLSNSVTLLVGWQTIFHEYRESSC